MTTLKRYDNPADVGMRLGSTYLRYKKKCYYVEHLGDFKLQLYTGKPGLHSAMQPESVVDANDPELDISSAPLGYCNVRDHGPVYLSRPAERRQRQGVSTNGISGFDEVGRQWKRPIGKYINLTPDCIISVVEGQYPSLKDIIEKQNPKVGAAFHRRLCLMPIPAGKGERLTWKIKYMATFVGLLTETPDGLVAGLIDGHGGNSFLRFILNNEGVQVHEYV